jgi:hypothetical protein
VVVTDPDVEIPEDPYWSTMTATGPIEAAGWIAIQLLQEPQGQ